MTRASIFPRGARLLVFTILFALLDPALAAEGERQVLPVDEASTDATWLRFKKRLMEAITARDTRYLLSIVDPNIRNQSEKARGVANFRKQWDIDAADTSLWRELSSALQLGAAYVKNARQRLELCAPYLVARWPADVEPFDHGAIVAREAVVQAEPSSSSPSLGTLSYNVVSVLDWEIDDKAPGSPQKWVRIQYDGRAGYVPEEHIRSPVEHAACFVKAGSSWRMVGFGPAGGE